MCGIAGLLTTGSAADRETVARMCSRLVHRGPDAEGYHLDGECALGHRRLAILDLATGDQPMSNEDQSLWIVFNGEIYNYRELRADLIRKGHRFRTQSDTEVLLHLFEDEGERTPEFLNGMFAFAIWNAKARTLFLARDRYGKKPLYYTLQAPGLRLAFASEIKALREINGFDTRLDPQALAGYLTFGYVADPKTIYRQAAKLPPAHWLAVNARGVRLRRYWSPPFEPDSTVCWEPAAAELRELAADAVKRRMISDVPLGAFLSGGVDSGAVTAHMCQASDAPVRTFSIGFTRKEYDELQYARLVARHCRTAHHEETVTPDVFEILPVLVEHFDEPFADNSAIPMLYLARMTRQHVTVALSGDGADELFAGYRRYVWGLIEERVRRRFPQWFRNSVIRAAGRLWPKFDYLPQVFRAKTTLLNLSCSLADAYFHSMTLFRNGDLANILSADMRASLGGFSPRDWYRERFAQVAHLPPLQQMQAVDVETWLPGDILVKADRATMAYSLEARSPWLDFRLGELAGRLPAHFKAAPFRGKRIFKYAVRDLLPEPVLRRRKMGFVVPMPVWLRTSLRPLFEERVLSPDMEEWINLAEVRRLWQEHQPGFSNHERKLWALLMLALWKSRWRCS
jgi:asparagine synthase (glutamine-hydrolysing)